MEKEHFEILLEDMHDSIKAIAEGHGVLNNKIDNLTNELRTGLKSTRDELIFLIKASNEHLEERLTKKIEDGDRAVVEQLTKRIKEGDDAVVALLTQQIDEVKDILYVRTEKLDDHERRIRSLEHKKSA